MSKTHKQWACFDFDGVIAEYNGWKGFDVLGNPIPEVVEAMQKLKAQGWMINVFTTRLATPTLEDFLKDNNIPFDSINSNAHNPPNTSQKPIYHVIIDDRAVGFYGQTADELLAQIKNVIDRTKH